MEFLAKVSLVSWLVVGLASVVVAQETHDNIWLLGYGDNNEEDMYGGCRLDFSSNPVDISFFNVPGDLIVNSILSDRSGNLVAYTNGCRIFNKAHALMANGDSINYGAVWHTYCDFDYPINQGVLLLPYPGDEHKAILLHLRIHQGFTGMELLYSLIDLSYDNGLGRVIEKNTIVDQMPLGNYLMATKHANGRDWWILASETGTSNFFSYLLSREGLSPVIVQSVGESWGIKYWGGQMIFSPDGKLLARIDPNNGLYLYDFDRCTGVLSNQRHFDPFLMHQSGGAGVAFSSDSKILYVTYVTKIFQLDLSEPDPLNSLLVVAEYDGFQAPFSATFYQGALAPDNKIYLTATNGVYVMHIIHHPERKGLTCNAQPHELVLPVHIGFHVPNFPCYRLGPLDGSPCDTLGLNNVPVADFRWEIDTTDDKLVLFRNTSYFLPETFSWTLGDAATSTEKDPAHGYAAPGIYEVCLTVSNAYGSDTKCREVDLLSSATSNPMLADAFRVYPNPATTSIQFEFGSSFSGRVVLFDVNGKMIRNEFIVNAQDHKMGTDDLSGMYFYQLIDTNLRRVAGGKVIVTE